MAASRVLRRFPRDAAFALTVGFCATPVIALGYFNNSVRETARPYVLHATKNVGDFINQGYVFVYRLVSPEHSPPPPSGPYSVQLRLLPRHEREKIMGVEEFDIKYVEVPESPLYSVESRSKLVSPSAVLPAAQEIESATAPSTPLAVPGSSNNAAKPASALRVRGVVSLGDLEAATRAMHHEQNGGKDL